MNILKYKYKAHKLVNTLFYLFVFLIGFVVGFTIKTFNFSNLLSEILMIDNVKAYTFYENENVKIDEDYIYKGFKQSFPTFDMSTYKNVACNFISDLDTFVPSYFYCLAFDDTSKDNISLNSRTNDTRYVFDLPAPSYYVYWTYDTEINKFSITDSSKKTNNYSFYVLFTAPYVQVRTNFNFDLASYEHNEMFNQLNFDKYTLGYSDIETKPTTDNYNNEEYIYNLFNEVMEKSGYNSKLEDYPNVLLYHNNAGVLNTYYYWFSTEEFTGSYSNVINNGSYYQLIINKGNQKASLEYIDKTDNITNIFAWADYPNQMATNSTGLTGVSNYLDFSIYLNPDYHLNDGSIFEDEQHLDFNKVCWQNFNDLMFSVTIDSTYDGSHNVYFDGQQDGETFIKSGFYVFDDITNLKRGTIKHTVIGGIDDLYSYKWIYGITYDFLSDKTSDFNFLSYDEKILARYYNPIDSLSKYDVNRLDNYYYNNLSKLKNSHYVDFSYYYNVLDDFRYDIFYLNEQKENFCIYIPKQFIVTTLSKSQSGGFIGDVPLHNDSFDSYIDNSVTNGTLSFNNLFSVINQFLSSIKDTVNVINTNIYNLFLSLPPILQMFIFTIIILIVIKTIIWMVVK